MVYFAKNMAPVDATVKHYFNGCRVRVYWNLRKKTYSIRLMESKKNLEKRFLNSDLHGRVIAYGSDFQIDEAEFVVNESGRQRVLKTGHKNIHAFVDGILNLDETPWRPTHKSYADEISYNPYTYGYFYGRKDYKPVVYAERVYLTKRKLYNEPLIYAKGTYR